MLLNILLKNTKNCERAADEHLPVLILCVCLYKTANTWVKYLAFAEVIMRWQYDWIFVSMWARTICGVYQKRKFIFRFSCSCTGVDKLARQIDWSTSFEFISCFVVLSAIIPRLFLLVWKYVAKLSSNQRKPQNINGLLRKKNTRRN